MATATAPTPTATAAPVTAAPSPSNGATRFLGVLREVERYPLPDLVMHQARRVETLVRHARANVPFYAERLGRAFDAGDALDLSRWLELPILTTAEARANSEAMRAKSVPDYAGRPVMDQTSGTGGESFHFIRSSMALSVDAANSLRIYVDHKFDVDGRFADMRIDLYGKAPYPDGALRQQWAFGLGRGDYAILDISTPVEDQVEWLLRMRPSLLFTWGMNARAVALLIEERGEELLLTSLATSAEACTAGVKADCSRVFGAEPVDIYGAREIGILAWHCHQGPYYHMAAESVFIEVIADDGVPAMPGETGRVVATPFYNFHMPFVRYATGDYVTLAEGICPCGRSLPTLSRLCGRDRNRLRLPDGERAFPAIPEARLDDLIRPLKWQLAQVGPERIEVRVDPAAMREARAAAAEIAEAVRNALGATFAVALAEAVPWAPGVWRKKRELFRADAF
jgi:phenylacetate-CoA ligase